MKTPHDLTLPTCQKQDVILQLIPELNVGGAEKSTIEIAQAIHQAGGTAIVCSSGGGLVKQLEKTGIEHILLNIKSKNPLKIIQNARILYAYIQEKNIKIIHARSRAPAWSGFLAAKWAKIPFMTTFHAAYNFGNPFKKFYNSVMTKGEIIIANSDFIKNHIIDNYHSPAQKIIRIHRGVDLKRFDPQAISNQKKAAFKRKWDIPKDKKIILMPARLTWLKGQEFLLKSLKELNRNDYYCVFMGSDQGREKYKKGLISYAASHDLSEKICFIEHCDDMPTAYAIADFVVNPSLVQEGFGRVSIEAQSMGKPVILTNHPAAYETIMPNETGYLVSCEDVKSLAMLINKLIEIPENQYSTLASKARDFVIANFDEQMMCVKTLQIYKKLLKK